MRGLTRNRLRFLRTLVATAGGRTDVGLKPQEIAGELCIGPDEASDLENWLSDRGYVQGMTQMHIAVTALAIDTLEELDEEHEQQGVVLPKNVVRETDTRLFISHAFDDRELAKAVVDLIEHVLTVDKRAAIRCTSVVGYTLSPGSNAGETLRANLRDCDVVLGLLTPRSLESKYVLMELGAAWGFQKVAIPLLVGVSFADLPGPFKDVHAVEGTNQAGVLSVLDVIEGRCGMQKRTDTGRLVERAGEFIALVATAARSARAPAHVNQPAATKAAEVSDDTAKMMLVLWLESQERTATAAASPVDIIQVANEAGVSVGQVERLIGDPDVLGERWTVKARAGGFLRLELGPARVRGVRGGR